MRKGHRNLSILAGDKNSQIMEIDGRYRPFKDILKQFLEHLGLQGIKVWHFKGESWH